MPAKFTSRTDQRFEVALQKRGERAAEPRQHVGGIPVDEGTPDHGVTAAGVAEDTGEVDSGDFTAGRMPAAASAAGSGSTALRRGTAHAGPGGTWRLSARSMQAGGTDRLGRVADHDDVLDRRRQRLPGVHVAGYFGAVLAVSIAGDDAGAAGELGDHQRARLRMALEPGEDVALPADAVAAVGLGEVAQRRVEGAAGVTHVHAVPAEGLGDRVEGHAPHAGVAVTDQRDRGGRLGGVGDAEAADLLAVDVGELVADGVGERPGWRPVSESRSAAAWVAARLGGIARRGAEAARR